MRPRQLPLWAGFEPSPTTLRFGDSPPTLGQAIDAFLSTRTKANTRGRYRWTLDKLAAHFGDAMPESSLELDGFMATQRSLRPASRDAIFRDVRAFFTWSTRKLGTADAGAGMDRPRLTPHLPQIISNDQVAQLLRVSSRRDRAIFAFALDTGARLSEIAGVHRSDITRTTSRAGNPRYTVRLRGSAGDAGDWNIKTGERIVPLSAHAAEFLIGVGAGDVLWISESPKKSAAGQPLTAHGVQLMIRRTTRQLFGRAYGPHVLRHTMATMYLRAGGDLESLRRILGHAKIETTIVYLHLVTEDIADKHDQFSPVTLNAQRSTA